MVPVIVEGPWDDLSYRPDLAGVAKERAIQEIQKVVPGAGGLPGAAPPGAPTQIGPASPTDPLRRLLGR
jgi:AsmA protein